MAGIVILGAGQAGASMAAKLRAEGYGGDLTILGAEPVPPYQRPPLSKAYLLGQMPLERLTLRGPDFWREQAITLRTNIRVTRIDREAQRVDWDGGSLDYEQLAICTGADPRRLPAEIGGSLPGVYCVRTLADIEAMKPEFRAGRRLVVIGGGYVGLETAAVARKLGLEVALIHSSARILSRVACAETAGAIRALHQAHGVRILEGRCVERLLGQDRVTGVQLSSGETLQADFVITGIGVVPAVDIARDAGLAIEGGILADPLGRSSDPKIWTAGDCAQILYQGQRLRIESVGNAIDMGELVARNMLGANQPYQPKPWFWSDQFDAKLQIAGWNGGYDTVVPRHGEGDSFWYYRDGRLIAVDALNDARAYMVGKRLIESARSPAPADIADPTTDLKQLMRQA